MKTHKITAKALWYFVGIWEVTVNTPGDRRGHRSSWDLELRTEICIFFQRMFQIWRSFSFLSTTTDCGCISASSFLLSRNTQFCAFKKRQ